MLSIWQQICESDQWAVVLASKDNIFNVIFCDLIYKDIVKQESKIIQKRISHCRMCVLTDRQAIDPGKRTEFFKSTLRLKSRKTLSIPERNVYKD